MSAALLLAGGAVVVWQRELRQAESACLGGIAGLLGLPSSTDAAKPIVFFTLPHHAGSLASWVGVQITVECTACWLIAPLLFVAAGLVLGHRLRVWAVLLATGATAALLVAVNFLRLTIIVLSTHWWGLQEGFRWSHEVWGSLIVIAGVAGGVVLFVKLAARLSRGAVDVPGRA